MGCRGDSRRPDSGAAWLRIPLALVAAVRSWISPRIRESGPGWHVLPRMAIEFGLVLRDISVNFLPILQVERDDLVDQLESRVGNWPRSISAM